jgi:hypothetical protein
VSKRRQRKHEGRLLGYLCAGIVFLEALLKADRFGFVLTGNIGTSDWSITDADGFELPAAEERADLLSGELGELGELGEFEPPGARVGAEGEKDEKSAVFVCVRLGVAGVLTVTVSSTHGESSRI